MKNATYPIIIFLFLICSVSKGQQQEKVEFLIPIQNDPVLKLLINDGTIDRTSKHSNQGWISDKDLIQIGKALQIQIPLLDTRLIIEENEKNISANYRNADTLGQVLEMLLLPASIEYVRDLTYQNGYFYIVTSPTSGQAKVFILNDTYDIVGEFNAPGSGSLLPWGIGSDGTNLYIADGIQDLIIKTDTAGNIISSFTSSGSPLSGLSYRAESIWYADLGSYPTTPPRINHVDTLGNNINYYDLVNSVNGVGSTEDYIILTRNKFNGNDILLCDPNSFSIGSPLHSFASPLDYPNGATSDGRFIYLCGKHNNQYYMVKISLGLAPPEDFIHLSPVNYDTVNTDSIKFVWQKAEDINGDSILYDLEIVSVQFDTIITNIPDTTLTLDFSEKPSEILYTWSVVAKDGIFEVESLYNTYFLYTAETGINQQDSELIAFVYPNPFSQSLNIKLADQKIQEYELRIFDITGKEIYNKTIDNQNTISLNHEIGGESIFKQNGVYLLELVAGNMTYTRKIFYVQK